MEIFDDFCNWDINFGAITKRGTEEFTQKLIQKNTYERLQVINCGI